MKCLGVRVISHSIGAITKEVLLKTTIVDSAWAVYVFKYNFGRLDFIRLVELSELTKVSFFLQM